MLIIKEIKSSKKLNIEELKLLVINKYHLNNDDIIFFDIENEAIDKRHKLLFVYNILIELKDNNKIKRYRNIKTYIKENISINKTSLDDKPIIIGYGPSGIFSAYYFLEAGIKSIVIEKGKRIKEREKDVELFFKENIFNEDSNIVFGEGGAGTFSDAKLTTRIKSPYISYIIDILIKFGAPLEIKYLSHPHIGTDLIRKVITNITDYLIDNGVEFHFNEEVIDFKFDQINTIYTNKNIYQSKYILLGIGHSSYQTIRKLKEKDVYLIKKDSAYGFRVEHPQAFIDHKQYGVYYHQDLPKSEYFLRHKDERDVYSFCMCPGGYVVASNATKKAVTTNGMSYYKRDSGFANSAILIQLKKDRFIDELSALNFIEEKERIIFDIDNSYKAISMNIKDYLNNDLNALIFDSTYSNGTKLYDFNLLFDHKENEIFKRALIDFDQKIDGFINEGIMVGLETRSSSPIRILRNDDLEAVNTKGLYPMGEGAGYGGGIMSCSLDGIRVAKKIIEKNNSL